MPKKKERYWVACEWATYFLASEQGMQPGAVEALDELNALMANYTREGYEPIKVIDCGPTKLVLEGGALDGRRLLVFWGRQRWVTPPD